MQAENAPTVYRLSHLTDLHFGVRPTARADVLAEAIAGLAPRHVVITGDVTVAGRRREFARAEAFLRSLPCDVSVVPGNHDTPVFAPFTRAIAPWRRFRRLRGALVDGVRELGPLRIFGLNSARRAGWHWDWSRGRLSYRQLAWLRRQLRADTDHLQVLALHHPVFLSESRAGGTRVGRYRHLYEVIGGGQLDLVLSGHAHLSRLQPLSAPGWQALAVQSGSALGDRLRGEPASFTVLDAAREHVRVRPFDCVDGHWCERPSRAFVRDDRGWSEAPAAPVNSATVRAAGGAP